MTTEDSQLKSTVQKSFTLALLVFAPFIVFAVTKISGLDLLLFNDACSSAASSSPCRINLGLIWLAVFSLACGMSNIGMIMSMTIRRQGNIFLLGAGYLEVTLFTVFGCIIGIIMLSLFIGGFLSGELFPNLLGLDGNSFINISPRMKDWAKLAIWGFVFGFSERLIPSITDSLAKQIEREAGARSDRAQRETLVKTRE